jgi:homocitrate synthase NifV/benzylmalate synthase
MRTVGLTIFDETLRDGEQQVGIFFDRQQKYTLAQLIAATGVHHIALMPAIHHTEAELVRDLIATEIGDRVVASTMTGKDYLDNSQKCGVKTVILFHAVSDLLLCLRDSELRQEYPQKSIDDLEPELIFQIRQRMLDKMPIDFKYAKSLGLKICFAAEDASRADFDFLVECINKFAPFIDHFLLCDTLGILNPESTKIWLRNLREFTGDIPLGVHFHNDRGLALENTIQAVLAGATGISGTFNGIGERSGNVALEQVLNGLKLRFGWQVAGINYAALEGVTNYLNELNCRPNQPYSPQSRQYETGIHVNSLLRDRRSYNSFFDSQPEIWFGKFSGASNFQYLFERYLNQPLSYDKYQDFRNIIKNLSIQQKRSFSLEEVVKILKIEQQSMLFRNQVDYTI